MDRLLDVLGIIGILVVLAGILPLVSTIWAGNTSPDTFSAALESGLPFIIAGLLIVGFVTAIAER